MADAPITGSGQSTRVAAVVCASALLALLVVPPSVAQQDAGFSDVPAGHVFETEIAWLASTGLTQGRGDGTFGLHDPVTRGAMAAFLYRYNGAPEGPFDVDGFDDVPAGHVFEQEVAWLASTGITQGRGDGTFGLNDPVTRGAMAAFLYRYDGEPGGLFDVDGFDDVPAGHVFEREVGWLASTGITLGRDDGTFGLNDPVTRGAMAAFLYRYDDPDRRETPADPDRDAPDEEAVFITTWDTRMPSGSLGPPADRDFVDIALAGSAACGITREEPYLVCWGNEVVADASAMLTPPEGVVAREMSAGRIHFCAVTDDGGVRCWGSNANNQLEVPSGLRSVETLDAGGGHTCAITTGGAPVCWGNDFYGQATPPTGVELTAIAAGGSHTCGLARDGRAACWGDDTAGQASPPADEAFVQVTAGEQHSCALTSAGRVVCWGADDRGQSSAPEDVVAFEMIDADAWQTCGLDRDGTARCWGNDAEGLEVPDGWEWTTIRSGNDTACGLLADGSAHCWGVNARLPEARVQLALNGRIDVEVDWGDGTREVARSETALQPQLVPLLLDHEYRDHGTYTVTVRGTFEALNASDTAGSLLSVDQWGPTGTISLYQAFWFADNLRSIAPPPATIEDLSFAFTGARALDQELRDWDVSNVVLMVGTFRGATTFDGDVAGWDVSNTVSMAGMFEDAHSFTGRGLESWDVSGVLRMEGMFAHARSFNGDIGGWDVSSVGRGIPTEATEDEDGWWIPGPFDEMFMGATSFDRDLSGWCVERFTAEPELFATDLPADKRPIWGTCPA